LARLVFFVATPACCSSPCPASTPADLLSPALATYVISAVLLGAATVAVSRLIWRLSPGESVIGRPLFVLCERGPTSASRSRRTSSATSPWSLSRAAVPAPDSGTVRAGRTGDDLARHRPAAGRTIRCRARVQPAAVAAVPAAGAQTRSCWRPRPASPWRSWPGGRRLTSCVRSNCSASRPYPQPCWRSACRSAPRPTRDAAEAGTTSDLSAGARVSSRTVVVTLVVLKLVVQPAMAYLLGRYGFGMRGSVAAGFGGHVRTAHGPETCSSSPPGTGRA